MANHKKAQNEQQFLALRTRKEQLSFLEELASTNRTLPVDLVDDALLLDIPLNIKVALIKVADSKDNFQLENFLIDNLATSHQDIAVTCLQRWCERSDRVLWHRIVNVAFVPHLPQRLKYRMIESANLAGGTHMINAFLTVNGIEEMSPAFQSILLQRAAQMYVYHERLLKLATNMSRKMMDSEFYGEEKGLAAAICYLAKFEPDVLQQLYSSATLQEVWRPILRSISEHTAASWPEIWHRDGLTKSEVQKELGSHDWQHFGGIPEKTLIEALTSIKKDTTFVKALNSVEGLINFVTPEALFEKLTQFVKSSQNPQDILAELNPRLKFELAAATTKTSDSISTRIQKDRKAVTTGSKPLPERQEPYYKPREKNSRQIYFDLAYREVESKVSPDGDSFWVSLAEAYISPDQENLSKITNLARKSSPFFQICFLNTLGRFQGNDEAALKLLDYIRTDDEYELRAALQALHGIGTPRAAMELVSALTRPNMSLNLQLEVAELLKDMELSGVQSELRSALSDLASAQNSEALRELIENLEQLLSSPSEPHKTSTEDDSASESITASKKDLDSWLESKIPCYAEMSSEVKRALRTAEFFHKQVTASNSHSSIDLSPVIDMQYKALELSFREMFEAPCKDLIHAGPLQRKLDVIGYARPIEQAMTQFEGYIGNLPIISSIPFFSKFKLRKMLRAICLFRPGRRFTLDGLKAFGLFFLCFGRKNDQYGLENILSLPFATDQELFEFTKKLHMFQDTRNRAAHEGFQPDAANDIDSIWEHTGIILGTAYKIRDHLKANGLSGSISLDSGTNVRGHKKAKDVEIIRKKVS